MPDDCLFCRIARGEIPATLVAETDDCVAFRDIDPKAPVHVLVIPRAHVASLDAATRYAESIEAIAGAGNKGGESARGVADSVATLAGTLGLTLGAPTAVAANTGAFVYEQIARIRAARSST